MNAFVALDLETTGLQPKSDRILEMGAVKIIDNQIVETYDTLVNPRMAIPKTVERLTGITQEMAETGIETTKAVKEIVDFCDNLPLLGHNILFDYSFIKHDAVNQGLNFEKTGIDTLKIARKVLPQLESRSLGALCEYYHIPQEHAHRAMDDAANTFLLYQKLEEQYYPEYEAAFSPKPLLYKPKKQGPITKFQKAYLIDLLKYHTIECNVEIDSLTKNEASRMIDQIILAHGRIKR